MLRALATLALMKEFGPQTFGGMERPTVVTLTVQAEKTVKIAVNQENKKKLKLELRVSKARV